MSSSPSVSLQVLVVSTFIALIMYGLSLNQTCRYFSCYPKDVLGLKIVITGLLLVNTMHAICVMQICYSSVVLTAEGHDSAGVILGLPYFWLLPITTTAVSVIVHYFFVRRVYLVSGRSRLFCTMTGSSLFVVFALSVTSAVYTFRMKQITYNPVIIMVISELSILIALNLFVNAKLVLHLHRARTGIPSTNSMINRIIKLSVHTGTISSLLEIAAIVLLLVSPGLFFMPLIQLLAGFEGNAVLVAVNSRRSMVDRGSSGIEIEGVDLDVDVRQETRRSTITWARGAVDPSGTIATIELGALPGSSSPSSDAGVEEPQKVGTVL